MATSTMQEILKEIDDLKLIEESDLNRLDELVAAYFRDPDAGDFLNAWFHLFERCEDNTDGIFMSILHNIETFHPKCDHLVVESVIRKPSYFPLMMVRRLVNGGYTEVSGFQLQKLLDENC